MARFSEEPRQFLLDVQNFLEMGPQAAQEQLSHIASWLSKLDLEKMDESHQSNVKVVQLLGTAVGKQWEENRVWQDPFREYGILTQILQNLDSSTELRGFHDLNNQYLRVIGNAIAYNDTNREIVVRYLPKILDTLTVEDLRKTSLAVLYNLGQDFEPANVRAAEVRLDGIIAKLLADGDIPEDAIEFATTILHRVTEQLTSSQLDDNASRAIFADILDTAVHYDENHCQDYVALLVYYLQDSEFQRQAATPLIVEKLLQVLLDFENNEVTEEEMDIVMQELSTQNHTDGTGSDETSVILLVRLVNSVSTLSASDAFVQSFTLESRVVQLLTEKLNQGDATPSTVCACIMLGNLATSDEVCINMVENYSLHTALIRMLTTGTEQALIYAASAFLRHLTFPEPNRPLLGAAGLVEVCSRLLSNQDPSVRGEAAAILCKLVTSCVPNIQMLVCHDLPPDIMLLPLPDTVPSGNPVYLDHLVRQALAPSAPLPSMSMKNPMIELGRALVAILRFIRRPTPESDIEEVARRFFSVPAVARPIVGLVRQRFYADARSEGLLGLGLMAQTPDGTSCVVHELTADGGLLGAIKELAGEKTSSMEMQKSDESAGRDYQNAMVLLHGLLAHSADGMETSLRREVEGLQNELSKLMIQG